MPSEDNRGGSVSKGIHKLLWKRGVKIGGGVVATIAVLASLAQIFGVSVRDIIGHSASETTQITAHGFGTSTSLAPPSSITGAPPTTSSPISIPPIAGDLQPTFTLALAPRSYVDLDHGAVSGTGGRQYELDLDFTGTRLFHLIDDSGENTYRSEYRIVPDAQYSSRACERSTHLILEWFAGVSDLQEGNNLCVSTSEHHWAIMKLTGVQGSSMFSITEVDFNVYIFKT
jgi:hypothetical protein